MTVKWNRLLIVLIIGLIIWFIPPPDAINLNAWHLFALFVATIAGFILQPIPIGAVAFCRGSHVIASHLHARHLASRYWCGTRGIGIVALCRLEQHRLLPFNG